MAKRIVCDTGVLISLYLLEKQIRGLLKNIKSKYKIIIPLGVKNELEEFAKYKDKLGKAAKKVLNNNMDISKIDNKKINNLKKQIRVSGKQRITDTDLECFILARDNNLAFFTDDFSVLIHLSSFFPEENIFHGILLYAEILEKIKGKEEAYNFIFEKFIPLRWDNITERRLVDLEKIVSEFFDK